jgi:hypothetical protein
MQFVPDWRGLDRKEATGDVEKVVFVGQGKWLCWLDLYKVT